jgi:hypothetical protein
VDCGVNLYWSTLNRSLSPALVAEQQTQLPAEAENPWISYGLSFRKIAGFARVLSKRRCTR